MNFAFQVCNEPPEQVFRGQKARTIHEESTSYQRPGSLAGNARLNIATVCLHKWPHSWGGAVGTWIRIRAKFHGLRLIFDGTYAALARIRVLSALQDRAPIRRQSLRLLF
jgi:hypothetical protein